MVFDDTAEMLWKLQSKWKIGVYADDLLFIAGHFGSLALNNPFTQIENHYRLTHTHFCRMGIWRFDQVHVFKLLCIRLLLNTDKLFLWQDRICCWDVILSCPPQGFVCSLFVRISSCGNCNQRAGSMSTLAQFRSNLEMLAYRLWLCSKEEHCFHRWFSYL